MRVRPKGWINLVILRSAERRDVRISQEQRYALRLAKAQAIATACQLQ